MQTEPSRGKEIRILGRGDPITIFPLTAAGFSIMRVWTDPLQTFAGTLAGAFYGESQIGTKMPKTTPEQNKTLVLEAFDTLFNKRDYAAAEKFWLPHYIQHSAHIPPGREGVFNLVRSLPPTLKYEHGTIVAEGNFVMVHGRFSNFGLPANWVAADILRIENGMLAEHWDVIEDEVTEQGSRSGQPMFGEEFTR